jgi:hypothetical protein
MINWANDRLDKKEQAMPEERPRDERTEVAYRSATQTALTAAAIVAPIAAPYIHNAIHKVTGPKDEPQVILPPGADTEKD